MSEPLQNGPNNKDSSSRTKHQATSNGNAKSTPKGNQVVNPNEQVSNNQPGLADAFVSNLIAAGLKPLCVLLNPPDQHFYHFLKNCTNDNGNLFEVFLNAIQISLLISGTSTNRVFQPAIAPFHSPGNS